MVERDGGEDQKKIKSGCSSGVNRPDRLLHRFLTLKQCRY
jgi:hypothetical protein